MGFLSYLKSLLKGAEPNVPASDPVAGDVTIPNQPSLEDGYRQLAGILSGQDHAVLTNWDAVFADPLAYLEELGYGGLEDETRSNLLWLALANVLQANDYLLIRDWKDELEDFTYFYDQLKPVQAAGLDVASLGLELDEDQVLSVWLGHLYDCLIDKGYCLGTMTIDSDSYHFLICPKTLIPKVDALATSLGQEIDFYG